jgi:site-specific DNA recombinase
VRRVEDELDDLLQKGAARSAAALGELAALESRVIDESDLREALASFMPVWSQLFPREKARILRLLVERVEYHAADGKVEIVFRPGGVRAMAGEAQQPG